jgi:NADH-quinone oxidoreductase subunit N
VLVYVLVYVFMTVGAFLVLALLNRDELSGEDIDDLRGLMKRHPGHALWMLIFMLSLAGIPPTAGFIGKYFIFLGLIEAGRYALAVIATLYVAVSIYYYFRIVKSMFVEEGEREMPPLATSFGTRVALACAGAATLAIGVYPEPFVRFAQQSFLR